MNWLRELAERDKPEGIELDDWMTLLEVATSGPAVEARQGAPRMGEVVEVRVSRCVYACCGKGSELREGYEQTYRGYVASLSRRSFLLTNQGLGTVSYTVVVELDELLELSSTVSPSL